MGENTIRIPCEQTSSFYGDGTPASVTTPGDHCEGREAKTAKTGSRSCKDKPQPVTAPAQISLDFGEAVRHESLPLTPCQRCGLEFGPSSIILHRQNCRIFSRHGSNTSKNSSFSTTPLTEKPSKQTRTDKEDLVTATTHTLDLPSIATTGVKVFGAPCKYCGERFGTHSLNLHMKRCRMAENRMASMFSVDEAKAHIDSNSARGIGKNSTTIGTINLRLMSGLGDLLVDNLSRHRTKLGSRPRTRSLNSSILLKNGFTLPSIDLPSSSRTTETQQNRKTTRPSPTTVSKGEITFPALSHRPQMTTNSPSKTSSTNAQKSRHKSRRPPTIVCYICGREYGTNSISIHEPQCLKKFETENGMLPVNERKPLPKKPITVNGTSTTVGPGRQRVAIVGAYVSEVLEATTEDYFQHCYSEWEKDLVHCKTCGRRFAPERHVKHAPRCKAKPLPDSAKKK